MLPQFDKSDCFVQFEQPSKNFSLNKTQMKEYYVNWQIWVRQKLKQIMNLEKTSW